VLGKPKLSLEQVRLDQDVYSLACERTAEVFRRFDHVMVAFSGGKDSTAVLNVALEVAHSSPEFARHLPLRVVHFDEEAIPYETEQYVRRVSQRDDVALEWYCLPVRHRNACSRRSPWWWPWAPEARDLWCRPLPPEAITELSGFPVWPAEARPSIPDSNGLLAPPRLGNVAMLMGIRAQESLTRHRALLRKRELNYLVKSDAGTSAGNLWKAYPVYDWTTRDVWTAPARLGWDYNRAYDRLEMAGLTHYQQRCSPAFGEEPLEKLHTYAQCFPDVWAKMVDRVPGVGAAARYARTELWAYRDRPEKPPGMLWPEFIAHYLGKFGSADAAMIAARVGEEMRLHYRKVSQPIAAKTRHPATGVSWEWLLMVAMRGDFKGRKNAGQEQEPSNPERTGRVWRRYAGEIAALIEAGEWPALAFPGPPPPNLDPGTYIPEQYREVADAGRG
jgi:predicted phosphoadenosine phosphosulfate sulfurtransferase